MKKIANTIIILFFLIFMISCGKSERIGAISEFSINDTLSSVNNEKVRVVLLYGQSNASGCSSVNYLQEKNPDLFRIIDKGIDNVFINYYCDNGANFSNGEFVNCGLREGANTNLFGPEVGIALTYQEAGLKCFIIKYSWGGTILDSQWMDSNYERGELYEAAINFTKGSLNYLISKGYNIEIDGICWMQGESDANAKLCQRYFKNTSKLVQYLRSDLKEYQETIDFIDAGISDSPYWVKYKEINEAKIKFSDKSEHNYYIDTIDEGLHYNLEPVDGPDLAHYDSESEIVLGRLFGKVAISKK